MTGKLAVGDRVLVERPLHGDAIEGTVGELLSKQFTYIDDNGSTHYCFYNGSYTVLGGIS